MNKLYILIITSLIINFELSAQSKEIKWSPFDNKDKTETIKIADKFMKMYIESDFQNMLKYLPSDEINYGGDLWLKTQQFISMIQSLRGKNEMEILEIKAYTMDDTEVNPDIKAIALKMSRIFNNYSIFTTIEILEKSKGIKKTICLNLNLDENKNWIISSFLDLSVGLVNNTNFPKEKFRLESFNDLKFEIPIPREFSTGQKTESQTTYILAGETERDATIQVDWTELKAPVNIMSYYWVQNLTSKYEHSDILIKYMPYGYKYEYFLKDQDGNSNKGITVAFESNNKFIFVQYFSFSDTYKKLWIDIDIMLRNIKNIK